ncbi:MAG TPA: histidine phosphatase family protein [bacterium]|nr:histidine phosphatase family protein [bacterium]
MKLKRFALYAAVLACLPSAALAKKAAPANTNELLNVTTLNNDYVVLRHGESVPSSEGRVCATLKTGMDPANRLTEKGREEVVVSTKEWIEKNKNKLSGVIQRDELVIVTSPYSRTKETAEIFADTMTVAFKAKLPKKYRKTGLRQLIVVEDDIREREFGKFEGQTGSKEIYAKVWAEDDKNPSHSKWGVEPATAVQQRSSAVIKKYEAASSGKLYVLVAHGDTLKILQTAFQKQSASEHQNKDSVVPIKTAEFRYMKLAAAPAQAQK